MLFINCMLFNCQPIISFCQKTSPPNIFFILADELGYGNVQCFDPSGKIATPNVDKLTQAGMKFTDAHASSSVCTPSRYSKINISSE